MNPNNQQFLQQQLALQQQQMAIQQQQQMAIQQQQQQQMMQQQQQMTPQQLALLKKQQEYQERQLRMAQLNKEHSSDVISADPREINAELFHVMRVRVPNFDMSSMIPPVRMTRELPKRFAITEVEKKKLGKYGKYNAYLKTSIRMQKQQQQEDYQRLKHLQMLRAQRAEMEQAAAEGGPAVNYKAISSMTPGANGGAAPGSSSPGGSTPTQNGPEKPKSVFAPHPPRKGAPKQLTKIYYFGTDAFDNSNSPYKGYDPDRNAWIMADFDGSNEYRGTVEGAKQPATILLYPLEVKKLPDGTEEITKFRVFPLTRTYKFTKKISDPFENEVPAGIDKKKLQQMKDEEMASVEDRLNKSVSKFRRDDDYDDPLNPARARAERENINKMKKKGGRSALVSAMLRDEDDMMRDSRRSMKLLKMQEDTAGGLDFDEEFADDEVVRLGNANAEDEKEALRRQYGKMATRSGYDELDISDDDEDPSKYYENKDKVLQKTLKRTVDEDIYGNDDQINPYVSDDDENMDAPDSADDQIYDETDDKLKSQLNSALSPSGLSDSGSSKRSGGSTRSGSPATGGRGGAPKRTSSIGKSPLGRVANEKNPARSPMYTAKAYSVAGSPLNQDSRGNSSIKLTLGKRKGTNDSNSPTSPIGGDSPNSGKRPRGNTSPMSSSSASEILKQYKSSSSPLGRAGSTSPQDLGARIAAGSQSQRSNNTTGSARSGTKGKKKSSSTPGGDTPSSVSGKKGSKKGRPLTQDDVVSFFKQKGDFSVPVRDLADHLLGIAGRKNDDTKNEVRKLLKGMVDPKKTDKNLFDLREEFRWK